MGARPPEKHEFEPIAIACRDEIEELILDDQRLCPSFGLALGEDGPPDAREVRVGTRTDAANDETRASQAAGPARHITSRSGIRSTVRITEPGIVERTRGRAKHRRDRCEWGLGQR